MLTRTMIQSLILSVSAFVSLPSLAAPEAPKGPCILHQHKVSNVKPSFESVYNGRRQQLRGAEMFVVAEPGLTAEWLQLTIARHITEMRVTPGMPNCPLSVDDVTVQVQSAGNGFTVRLIAPTQTKAEEVLRRAKLLNA